MNTAICISSSVLTIIVAYSVILYYLFHKKKSTLLKLYIMLLCIYLLRALGDLTEQLIYLLWPGRFNTFVESIGKYRYTPVYFESVVWLSMCMIYSGITRKYKLDKKIISIILFPSMVNLIIYLTNSYHKLYGYWSISEQKYISGLGYLIHIFTCAIYCILSIYFLIYGARGKANSKKLTILMLLVNIPTFISFFYYFKGYFNVNVLTNIVPAVQLVSLVLFIIAVFKFKFMNIVPIAVNDVFTSMEDVILVVNDENKIISFNNSYKITFSSFPSISLNDDIKGFTTFLQKNVRPSLSLNKVLTVIERGYTESFPSNYITDNKAVPELILNDEIFLINEGKFLSMNVRPVIVQNNILGRIIAFRDITEYKKINEELYINNCKLEAANSELKEYSAVAKELAVSKERNRFARELHDSAGHTMSLLISILSSCLVTYEDKKDQMKEKLEQILSIAQEGLIELRRSVYGLNSEKLATFDLINRLNELKKKYEQSGVNIILTVEGPLDNSSKLNEDIYAICKECITNALKHGKPNQVEIILGLSKNKLRAFIIDDGTGCREIIKGLGLKGIESRVAALNGSLSYGSDGEKGFSIHVELPLEEIKECSA